MKRFSFALAALLAAAPAFATEYKFDQAHSQANFAVKHMMVSTVRGQFKIQDSSINYDAAAPANSTVSVTLDASSINTGQEKRDGHLKSPDFFDVAKFPTITFKSTKVEKSGEGLKVTGDLTMHGITKPVTFDVEGPAVAGKNPWGQAVLGASASAKINREDFGLTWNKALESGGVLVGKEVTIEFSGELNPAQAGK